MSESLSPDLVKASTGNYSLPIYAIFSKSWQSIKGIKKAFWGGFALIFLIIVGIYVLLGFLLAVCAVGHFYYVGVICQFFVGGIIEVLRLVLSIALIFLALHHFRKQTVNSAMVFKLRKNWKPLACIGILLYLLNIVLFSGTNLILYKFFAIGLNGIFASGLGLRFIVFAFLYAYITLLITMTMVLILDKKMQLKASFKIALKSINQHWFKNIALLLLAMLVFLVGGILTLGIGVIWLLPLLSLITAIQYEQIFCAAAPSVETG